MSRVSSEGRFNIVLYALLHDIGKVVQRAALRVAKGVEKGREEQVEEVGRPLHGSTPCKFSVEYRSVIVYGRVRFLEEDGERLKALRLLLRKYGASEAAEALSEEMLGGVLVGEITVEEMTGRCSP